jgi:hypothetical protein
MGCAPYRLVSCNFEKIQQGLGLIVCLYHAVNTIYGYRGYWGCSFIIPCRTHVLAQCVRLWQSEPRSQCVRIVEMTICVC